MIIRATFKHEGIIYQATGEFEKSRLAQLDIVTPAQNAFTKAKAVGYQSKELRLAARQAITQKMKETE